VRLDANETTLQMSQVYYNYLHLSMQEEHYYIDPTANPQPAYRTVNTYNIPSDQHARATSYSQPIQIEQFHYSSSAADYRPLRRATSTYDEFGCPLTTVEEMWNTPTNAYIQQKSATSTYTGTTWGGEMLQSEIYADHVAGRESLITYELDAQMRHIAASSVKHRQGGTSDWKPWKNKSYTYDTSGRVTVETVAWSAGVDIPQGSVQQYTYAKAYNFDATTGILTSSTTDPLGKTGRLSYQMKIAGGPLVKKTSPLGITETLKYDLLGRVIEVTNGLGFTTKTSYSVNPGLTVQTVNAMGYIIKRTHDVLGRVIQIADSGNQGTEQTDRILSQTEYDAVSNVTKSTNELDLVTTWSYDAFNRVIQKVDTYGNVTTSERNDDKLTTEHRLNGDLRTKSFADGLGRPIKIVSYADSAAALSYELTLETVYDGFGKVTTSKHSQQPLDGSAATLLSQKDTVYDVEEKPYSTALSGLPSTLTGNMDQVVRKVTFDIFGNSVTYTKAVRYGDGRQYSLSGPVSLFDACDRLVRLTNQLGQVEINEFDVDGRLTTMTRYDGTKFNYTYDQVGQLLSSSSPDGTTVSEYLPNGRLAKVTRGTATITHTYTPDGCINSTLFPDGRSQTYVLDRYSRVIREVDAAGRATENTFDASGRIGTKQMGNNKIDYHYGTANHTKGMHIGSSITGSQQYNSEIAYDGFGRQCQVTDRNQEGSIILKSVYLRDSRGNLTSREVSSQTHHEAAVNNKRLFMYDGYGQLTSDSASYQQDGVPAQTHEFKYDGNWNVIEKTTNGSSSQFKYNTLDQRQDPGFVYDANGRISSDLEGRQYSYDSEDRLTSVTYKKTTTYTYHPDSSLANSATANANTTFYYNCGAVNSTLDTAGKAQSWTSYLLEPRKRVAAEKEGKDTTLFLDSQNSVVMSLGTAVSATYDYQAYGAPTTNTTAFGWQQELTDRDSGLIYLRSRYYQTDHMAFITMDSSRGQENRYAYCHGDPINLADGSGHDAINIGATIAGIVVGITVGVLTGGLLAPVAADICATSLTTIGVAAASVSGAAGTIAGDATTAAIQHQPFTAARAGEDLLVGAVGGAVGAGSGGLASSAAMRMALNRNFSQAAIAQIGNATASIIGGGAGGFASSETSALLHHEPLISSNTAFSAVLGFGSGALGSIVASGSPSTSGNFIPVELNEAETGLIAKATIPPNPRNISNANMFLMSTPEENDRDWRAIRAPGRNSKDVLRTQPGGQEHYTIVAHGAAGRMYASATFQGRVVYRPINASRLANVIMQDQTFQGARASFGTGDSSGQIKLISCNGGWSNAQKIADALQLPVWAAYKSISVVSEPNWHLFRPRP
jgi:RHS repeat-associated protein